MCVYIVYILIYIYKFVHVYIYLYIYTCKSLPVNAIVRLAHIRRTYSQEMFLASSADKQTQKYDSECSKHYRPYQH